MALPPSNILHRSENSMKTRLVVGLLASALMAAMLSGPAAAKPKASQFLGPDGNGNCVTLEITGSRVSVGHARVRYTDEGYVQARLRMKRLIPNQEYEVFLHQEGDADKWGVDDACIEDDVHLVTTNARRRIKEVLKEEAVPGSLGMFVFLRADPPGDHVAYVTKRIFYPRR
jgi:hypothetical protein